MTELKKHNLRIEIRDFLSSDNFKELINNKYPNHAELLIKYRKSMLLSIVLIVLVVSGLAAYLIMR